MKLNHHFRGTMEAGRISWSSDIHNSENAFQKPRVQERTDSNAVHSL